MSQDTVINVEGVSKKFCRSLKYTMLYGARDVARDVLGFSGNSNGLRQDEFWALKDVTFEVKRGECVGLIGPNGAGKSTLLKLLNGITLPDKGTIKVTGRIGALLELGAGFHPLLTGRENIRLNAAILGLSEKEIDEKFDDIVDFAELREFLDMPLKHYSTGMCVRLGFAVVISANPDILFIDEALAVGDTGFQQKCLQRIQALQNCGTTMVVVTHDIQMIKNYCSSAIYLKAGGISFQGYPEAATEVYVKDLYENRQRSMNGKGNVVLKRSSSARSAFGTQHGQIIDASLWCREKETNVFSQSELLKIRVVVWVDESVVNPEIVMQVRDMRGYTLYGIDSLSAGIAFPQGVREQEVIEVEFAFEVFLAPGDFAIALGLNDRINDAVVILHEKLVGSLTFTVIGDFRKCHGAVDLRARCQKPEYGPEYVQQLVTEIYGVGHEILETCLKYSPLPQTLASLVRVSKRHFGFFSGHLPRFFEYPWMMAKLRDMCKKNVLDVGAGLSPLPLLLAEQGVKVTTVDNSPDVRSFGDQLDRSNEWGFFDYSAVGTGIRSIHDDILSISLEDHSFDCIYSVSVIEHLLASVRRQLWQKMTRWLSDDGILLLTFDLFPESDQLWNYSQGQTVDAAGDHGSLETLQEELLRAGFQVVEQKLLRGLPKTRVDIAFIHLVKK